MIGVCVAIFVIALTPHEQFVSGFNALTSYQSVIDSAAQEGFPVIEQWNDAWLSLIAIGFSGLTVLYTQNNVYGGGELQNPKRNMFFSIMGSLAILAPLTVIMAFGMQFVLGDQFLASLYYLQLIGKSPLTVPASYNLFASLAGLVIPFSFLVQLAHEYLLRPARKCEICLGTWCSVPVLKNLSCRMSMAGPKDIKVKRLGRLVYEHG
jgi:amino acid transporter